MFAEGDKLNAIILDKERKEIEKQQLEMVATESEDFDEGKIIEMEEEIYQLTLQVQNINDSLESFEDSYNFHLEKLNRLNEEAIALDANNIEPLKFTGLQSVDAARVTLQTFFSVMLDLNIYKRDLETKCIESDDAILELNAQINFLNSRIDEILSKQQNGSSNFLSGNTSSSDANANRAIIQANKERALKSIVNVRNHLSHPEYLDNRGLCGVQGCPKSKPDSW